MDKIEVWPKHKKPTHHLSLSDGDKTIGLTIVDERGVANEIGMIGNPMDRTPLKFSEGMQKYSDMVYPWSTIAQESWINGRGAATFEDDASKYYDSRRMWTVGGELQLAGLETYTEGMRDQNKKDIGSVSWKSMIGDARYIAVRFTASATYDIKNIYLLVRRVGTPANAITIQIKDDAAVPGGSDSNPGSTVLRQTTITTTDITDILAEYFKKAVALTSITSGTNYWVVIQSASGTETDHWEVGVEEAAGTTKNSTNGTLYYLSDYDLYYRLTDTDSTTNKIKFFNYRYQMWAVQNKGAGVAPALWVHGDYGVADSNSADKTYLQDASKSAAWEADEFIGCIVWIIKGTGSDEEKPYRVIVDNTTTALEVDEDWVIAHDTTTEYVIVGGNAKWLMVPAVKHNLAANKVTDVKIFNDAVYFCQGDALPIHRFKWYQNGGALGHLDADDGTNKATHIEYMLDNTDGAVVWKSNNSDAASKRSVAYANAPTTWANMTFNTAILVDKDTGKINLIKGYSDAGTRQLWIFTEGFIYKINDGKLDPIPLEELQSLMYYLNANCAITHNVFMLFPWGKGGLERYYDLNMDDVGPNRDEGLPSDRQGYIVAMEPHPGKYMVAVDAGTSGYSTIHFNNGTDNYHEIYRAPAAGQRIQDVKTQVIPEGPNRMWVAIGSDIIWLPMPTATVKPSSDPNFPYVYEGVLESGWMHAAMPDVWKFFHSVKMWSDNLVEDTDGEGGIDFQVQIKYDTEEDWVDLPSKFYEMPSQEVKIKEVLGVNAKRAKYRVIARTNNKLITPIGKSIVMENAMRISVKYAFQFRVRVTDNDRNAQGQAEDMNGKEKMDVLKSWMDNITPLYMRTMDHWSDKKTVFLQPIPYQKNKKTEDSWILQGVAVEI